MCDSDMLKPENLYAMPRELVCRELESHCARLEKCKTWHDFYLLRDICYWFLAAIYHSGLDFDTFDCIIRGAINAAEARLDEGILGVRVGL